MKYAEQLRDPRWQRKRLEIMERADFSCENCGNKAQTLAVHHRLYLRGHKPWEYENDLLECLCDDCHKSKHKLQAELNAVLVMSDDIDQVIGYAKGLYTHITNPEDEITIASWEQAAGFLDAWGHHIKPHDFLAIIEKSDHKISGNEMASMVIAARTGER